MRVFEEKQRFNQWWLYLVSLSSIGFLIYSYVNWLILEENMGNISVDDTVGQILFTATIVLCIALPYIFKLETIIDERGISYRFFPFQLNRKKILWYDIEKCYLKKYRPIQDFGGWGYKFNRKGIKAMTIKGNEGIQIELKTGKRILLGTQKSTEVQPIINRYLKNKN